MFVKNSFSVKERAEGRGWWMTTGQTWQWWYGIREKKESDFLLNFIWYYFSTAWKSSFRQNYGTTFSPTVPPSATRISRVVADVEAPGGEVGTSKRGGKQWQTTPKNLPRMHRTRTIPVTWLSSSFCPNRPKGWIPIIIIIIILYYEFP